VCCAYDAKQDAQPVGISERDPRGVLEKMLLPRRVHYAQARTCDRLANEGIDLNINPGVVPWRHIEAEREPRQLMGATQAPRPPQVVRRVEFCIRGERLDALEKARRPATSVVAVPEVKYCSTAELEPTSRRRGMVAVTKTGPDLGVGPQGSENLRQLNEQAYEVVAPLVEQAKGKLVKDTVLRH